MPSRCNASSHSIAALAAFAVSLSLTGCASIQSELKSLKVKPTLTANESGVCVGFDLVDSAGTVRVALEPQCFGYDEVATKIREYFPWLMGIQGEGERGK